MARFQELLAVWGGGGGEKRKEEKRWFFSNRLSDAIPILKRMKGGIYKLARNATYSFRHKALSLPHKSFIYSYMWLILLSS